MIVKSTLEEVALKDRQYSGQIPGEFIVRTNEHTFDGGRRLLGRYGEDGYLTPDLEVLSVVEEALAVVGTQEERAAVYNKAHKMVFERHYDFSPGYINLPYGVGQRIESWEPWGLAPYASALWTVRFK